LCFTRRKFTYVNALGKIFPADRVRIAREICSNHRPGLENTLELLILLGFHLMKFFGAMLAIDQVGQRDTRW
jgi:hypothetical protein